MAIEIPRAEVERFCSRNHIRKLSLFGSILTDRFRPDSDVDVLVEFEPGATITYLDLARMEREFSDALGRKVDLRTSAELSRYFRERVVSEAVVQYERD
jgi:predicted nucleotidyltransferase